MTSFLLHCNAVKLARKDGLFGKSDPFVIIKTASGKSVAYSNVIKKDLNPTWDPIAIDEISCGGMNGVLVVEVYDWDTDGDNDFIGSFKTNLRDLTSHSSGMSKSMQLFNANMKKAKPQGVFFVSKTEVDPRPKAFAYSIRFAAKSLANKDSPLGKSDPFMMIYTYGASGNTRMFVAKTEYKKNDLNPAWDAVDISVHACGGLDGVLTMVVYDYENDGAHEKIGECETSLRQLVTSSPMLPLLDEKKVGRRLYKNSGILSVINAVGTTPQYDDNITRISIQFRGRKLSNKDFMSKSDPYLVVKKDEKFSLFQTPHVNNDLNPVWAPFDLHVADCGGLQTKLLFEVWDHDSGSDDFIGSCSISLRHLMYWQKNSKWRLKDPKKPNKANCGFLEVVSFSPFVGGPSAVAASQMGRNAAYPSHQVPQHQQRQQSHPSMYQQQQQQQQQRQHHPNQPPPGFSGVNMGLTPPSQCANPNPYMQHAPTAHGNSQRQTQPNVNPYTTGQQPHNPNPYATSQQPQQGANTALYPAQAPPNSNPYATNQSHNPNPYATGQQPQQGANTALYPAQAPSNSNPYATNQQRQNPNPYATGQQPHGAAPLYPQTNAAPTGNKPSYLQGL